MASTPSITAGGKARKLPTADSGWYVFIGVMTGVLTANTRLAPYVFGVLGVALLFQIGQLLRGNYSYS